MNGSWKRHSPDKGVTIAGMQFLLFSTVVLVMWAS